MKGFCEHCGTEIEISICCSGHECGCMGQPTEPPICSEYCYYMAYPYQRTINNIDEEKLKKLKTLRDEKKVI